MFKFQVIFTRNSFIMAHNIVIISLREPAIGLCIGMLPSEANLWLLLLLLLLMLLLLMLLLLLCPG